MKRNWNKIFGWELASEGGYVNNPEDPGGATNMGVTQRTYDATTGLNKSVKMITEAEVRDIFNAQYFQKVMGDDLPDGLDYAVVDYAINSGPSRAVKALQRQLNVTADGIMGAQTLRAIKTSNIPHDEMIVTYCTDRLNWMKRLKTWKTFGRGWSARVMGREIGAQADDIGVIDRAVRLARGANNIPTPIAVAPAKAIGPETVTATLTDALKSPQALGTAGSVVGSVATMASGTGPVQIALAIVLVLGAVAGIIWMLRHEV